MDYTLQGRAQRHHYTCHNSGSHSHTWITGVTWLGSVAVSMVATDLRCHRLRGHIMGRRGNVARGRACWVMGCTFTHRGLREGWIPTSPSVVSTEGAWGQAPPFPHPRPTQALAGPVLAAKPGGL